MVKRIINEDKGENVSDEKESSVNSIIGRRKEKFKKVFLDKGLIFIVGLVIILAVTINVRTSNISGLKDVTTGNYTLAPDLDPFLFLRWAKYIAVHGSIMDIDTMRYSPLGYHPESEALLTSYLIVYIYKMLIIFSPSASIEFAAVIYPVIFFSLATIFFFLFVRRLFIKYSAAKRNLISLLATLLFVFMPSMLHRTTGGVPEKEAAGIMFVFLALYLFICALQGKSMKNAFILGFLSGLATSLLNITWGGVNFVILSIELSIFVYLFIGSITKREFLAYSGWIAAFTIFSGFIPFTAARSGFLLGLLGSTITQIAYFVFFVLCVNMFLTPRVYSKMKIKMPQIAFSLIFSLIAGLLFLAVANPAAFASYTTGLKTQLLHPMGTDRITLTVAENNQPYFGTWKSTFTMRYFWLFMAGAAVIFYEAIAKMKKQERIILSAVYSVFLVCLIFSRYASNSLFNGTSTISQIVYFGGFAIFALSFFAVYYAAQKSGEIEKLKNISKEFVLILIMFFIVIISARGAIRLFFLLAPVTTILASFITVELVDKSIRTFRSKNELATVIYAAISLCVIFLILLPSINSFAASTIDEAKMSRPGYYEVLWQKAMAWVRANTPVNAVFSHWWDYGYWIQTIGERATFLDGGNAYGYWDYQMGRHVLTGQSEQEALEVLKTHNVSYLLIDPTDIGKYSAYSSIGSDLNYDRYNYIPTFMLDEKQTQETRNEKIYWYQGGTLFTEDFVWFDKASKQQFLFPAQNEEAIIAGVLLPLEQINLNETNLAALGGENEVLLSIKQPTAVVVYKHSTRIDVPLCDLYYNGAYNFEDDGPCLKAGLYVMPKIVQSGAGVNIVQNGAAVFLNEKAMKALWVKLYFFNKGKNFELVHTEPNPILEQMNQQGANLPDFAFYTDVFGPIKIWKINYPANVTAKPEYLNTLYPDKSLTIAR
ncbi:MAG: STT3 domain-containing protein [archaeon]